jgi:hypothetical protein
VAELIKAAERTEAVVNGHIKKLVEAGVVEGPTRISCHCDDEMWRDADLEVGREHEPSRAVSQGYYRLTELGVRLLAAHPIGRSEGSTPRTPPGV